MLDFRRSVICTLFCLGRRFFLLQMTLILIILNLIVASSFIVHIGQLPADALKEALVSYLPPLINGKEFPILPGK